MEHGPSVIPMRRQRLRSDVVRASQRGGCSGMQGEVGLGNEIRIPEATKSPVMPVEIGGTALFLTLEQLADLPSRIS